MEFISIFPYLNWVLINPDVRYSPLFFIFVLFYGSIVSLTFLLFDHYENLNIICNACVHNNWDCCMVDWKQKLNRNMCKNFYPFSED